MSYRFYFCDPVASFGQDSAGRKVRRLIDHWEHPHLGHELWQIGSRAYELLGVALEQPPTLEILRALEAEGQFILDAFFEELNSAAGAGHVSLINEHEAPVKAPVDWREADWSWQVLTMARFARGISELLRTAVGGTASAYDKSIHPLMLVAVFHLLDNAVLYSRDRDAEGVTASVLDASWLLDQVEAPGRLAQAAVGLDSRRASERARLRHARDPKRQAREFVRECWKVWRQQPSQYPSTAAFARAMLDKEPETLTSEVVVARWVRTWDKEAAEKLTDAE